MPETPKLRLVVDNDAERETEFARSLEFWSRLKAVAPDPDGRHIWVLLDDKAPAAKG